MGTEFAEFMKWPLDVVEVTDAERGRIPRNVIEDEPALQEEAVDQAPKLAARFQAIVTIAVIGEWL
ncbi:hypothetical protein GCM10010532_107510 [Dactylosporangium siamense]|uniref:Uncharacterized protein n=2 Tax=Dactylosporangium siamense TaxID=685454 RepID=A0A919PZ07_9ACTN|nr:hypothetical protein Dsi01nite_102730 [Dactylosporangium siamense]